MLRLLLCFSLMGQLLMPGGAALAQTASTPSLDANPWIYWGKRGELGRTRLDGSQQEILLRSHATLQALAFDPAQGTLFLGDLGRGAVDAISSGTAEPPRELLLDQDLTDIAYHDGQLFVAGQRLLRLDPATGEAQPLIERTWGSMPKQVAVGDGWIFWSTAQERIQRARLDGSRHDDEFLWADRPETSLATDKDHLYGLETNGRLWRASLHGQGKTQLAERNAGWAVGLTHHDGRLYWAECEDRFRDGSCVLVSAAAAGGEVTQMLERSERVHDLAVHGDALYWLESKALMRQALGGGPVEVVSQDLPVHPESLAGDGTHLYRWEGARLQNRKLIRSRMDGSAPEILLNQRPGEFVGLDGDRLVWVERHVQRSRSLFGNSHVSKIFSAPLEKNQDLGAATELVALEDALRDVRLHDGWLYWIRELEVERRRLQAQGEVETVVSGDRSRQDMMRLLQGDANQPPQPDHIAGDAGWVFWADNSKKTISRMGLDGTRRRDVLNQLGYLTDMAAGDGHIVWSSDGSLISANLDGTERTVLAKDLEGPDHLATHDGWIYFEQTHLVDGDLLSSLGRLPLDGGTPQILVQGDAIMGPGVLPSRRQRELVSPGVTALTVSGYGLLWAEAATGRLLLADHDGADIQQIRLPETLQVNVLTSWGEAIYGADNARRLWRLHVEPEADTSDPTQVPGAMTHLRRLDGDVMADLVVGSESQLLWSTRLSDSLVRYGIGERDETPMLEAPPPPSPESFKTPRFAKHLAVDADGVYLVDGVSNSVDRVDFDGLDRQPWVKKLARGVVSGLHRAGDHMVWLDVDGVWVAPMDQPEQRRQLVARPGITTLGVIDAAP